MVVMRERDGGLSPDEIGAMDGDKRGLDSQSQVTSGPSRTAPGAPKEKEFEMSCQ